MDHHPNRTRANRDGNGGAADSYSLGYTHACDGTHADPRDDYRPDEASDREAYGRGFADGSSAYAGEHIDADGCAT